LPAWVGLVVGLSIGLVVAAIIWIERPTPPSQLTAGTGHAAAVAPARTTAVSTTPATTALPVGGPTTTPAAAVPPEEVRKAVALPPKQASRFGFYKILSSDEYEVVIPKEDAAPKAAGKISSPLVAAAIAAPGQYLIQVGAYRTREEAEKGRANLALLGVESRIEQVTIDQSENWFRVRIGPENDLAKAQEILERLESNDIKAMLIKVKSG